MPAESAVRETIVVIHGTWANDAGNLKKWYMPSETDNFITRLNKALTERHSSAACWAHVQEPADVFLWQGKNYWIHRAEAALKLQRDVHRLIEDGWICHLVAHSHGGNIVNDAFPNGGKGIASIITLGTPFLNIPEQALIERFKWSVLLEKITRIILFIASIMLIIYMIPAHPRSNTLNYGISSRFINELSIGIQWEMKVFMIVGMIFIPFMLILTWRAPGKRSDSHFITRRLAINSDSDEVWQFIYNISHISNPFLRCSGWLGYAIKFAKDNRIAFSVRREVLEEGLLDTIGKYENYFILSLKFLFEFSLVIVFPYILYATYNVNDTWFFAVAKGIFIFMIVAVISFMPIGIAIILWGHGVWPIFVRHIRIVSSYVVFVYACAKGAVTYFLSDLGWSHLRASALGLYNYTGKMPEVRMNPDGYLYENLPASVVDRARENRRASIASGVDRATELFTQPPIDVEKSLRQIMSDTTLVHAAYYEDDECIIRIANWICDS